MRTFATVSLLFVLLWFLGASPAPGLVFSTGSEAAHANILASITLDPLSDARFFECEVSPANGTSSLPNKNAEESAQSVLTDGNLDTILMGSSIFNVSSTSNSIVNMPGPDLEVIEMAGPEPTKVSINDPETREAKPLVLTPSSGVGTNNCGYAINQIFVDFSDFGVPLFDSVSSVSLDNLGVPNSLQGSDIAEVIISPPETSNKTESHGGFLPFIPFFGQ